MRDPNLLKVVIVPDRAGRHGILRSVFGSTPPRVCGASLCLEEAQSGAGGLELVRQANPDLLLLDYQLPDMDGLDFLRHLRSDPRHPYPGLMVVLTGVPNDALSLEASRAGADYLVKEPVTPDGLRAALEQAVRKIHLIGQLREQRDRMAQSLEDKELLIKEIHHRAKNNLQVIASLLRLEAEALADPAASRALRDSQHRAETMALAHEQLYTSENLRQVDLGRHARHILANLFQSYGVDRSRIDRSIDVVGDAVGDAAHGVRAPQGSPLVLGVDQAIPAGLILNELVSNALLHAFPKGRQGTIRVAARKSGGQVTLSVHDDGIGMPPHFDFEKSPSLGLRIVHILTRQLKGSVRCDSRRPIDAHRGTSFEISFPEDQSGQPCKSQAAAGF